LIVAQVLKTMLPLGQARKLQLKQVLFYPQVGFRQIMLILGVGLLSELKQPSFRMHLTAGSLPCDSHRQGVLEVVSTNNSPPSL
jgi:hypothetical protein